MTNDDMDRVVPLGQLDDFQVAEGDPDVRGWEVLASDGRKIGEVDELLVDTNAMKVRYLDVDVDDGVIGDDRHVLIPIGYARLERGRDRVLVDGLVSSDLHGLPPYGQGPLTRDFENSVRESFARRDPAGPSAGVVEGMAGLGMMDTAGLDNTPGMGTGMGLGIPRAGDPATGETMRGAGFDQERDVPTPPRTEPEVRDTGSLRTGLDPDRPISAASTGAPVLGSPMLGAPVPGGDIGEPLAASPTGGGRGNPPAPDRVPREDTSHRAGTAGSSYMHNADEDFYASDAFDEDRFYGREAGGAVRDPGTDRARRRSEDGIDRPRTDPRGREAGGAGSR